jgi:acetylornithine deacetylase/succinyl-diaminopimelate desuccinylase-like protein
MVRVGSRVPPTVLDADHPAMAAASAACRRGFGARPAYLFSGGTVPAAGMLNRVLGIPVILLGLALPDDRAHAPNERFHLPNLWAGIATSAYFLAELARSACAGRTAEDQLWSSS